MNFLRSGLQDVRRRIHAQQSKLSLSVKRRELRHAEVALGNQYWEEHQNEPEIAEFVGKLRETTAARATLLTQRETLEKRRALISGKLAEEKAISQKNLSALGALRTPKLEELKALQSQVAAREREHAQIAKELRAIDAEEARLRKSLAELDDTEPGAEATELRKSQIGDRVSAIPAERESVSSKESAFQSEIQPLLERRDHEKQEIDKLDDQIRAERNRFDAEERIAKAQLRDLDLELASIRRSVAELDASQSEPFGEIGRWIAAHRSEDPAWNEKTADVRARQLAVKELEDRLAEIRIAQSTADPQDLRKFYFVAVSVLTLISLSVTLVFSSPSRREWLPSETSVIVSVNATQFDESAFGKKWQGENPKGWALTWTALMEPAQTLPNLNLKDVCRITRAIADRGERKFAMFTLVELKQPVFGVLETLSKNRSFTSTPLKGIDVISNAEKGDALAPVGPNTFAVGSVEEVEDLVRVRLGIKPDLKIDEHFFAKFRRLQQDSTFSLISRDPERLKAISAPLFTSRLLDSSRLVGLALQADSQVQARLLIRAEDSQSAAEFVRLLRESPRELLRLGDDDVLLFKETPVVSWSGHEIDARFTMPTEAATLFFERVIRVHVPEVVEAGRVGKSH